MKYPKISVIIAVYKPDLKILEDIRTRLKEQTVKSELVENWNMPEAVSMNTAIKKSKGEIVVTLCQDCLPENEFWLEKLVEPLIKDKEVIATVSDLALPRWYWKKYPFLVRMTTMKDLGIRRPGMDARACAFRRKILEKVGLFNEDPNVIAIDRDLYNKIKGMGKIIHPNVNVLHLHPLTNIKKIKLDYKYAKAYGLTILDFKPDESIFWIRIFRAIPLIGIIGILPVFPFKKYAHYFPLYILFSPVQHAVYLFGFWIGFFSGLK